MHMNSISTYIRTHYREDKSIKSLWNIVTGARTQQTYFDASMQHLLPVYEIAPGYPFEAFTSMLSHYDKQREHILFPYFYLASEMSFETLSLLIQASSEMSYGTSRYVPVSNNLIVQSRVKEVIRQAKAHDFNLLQLDFFKLVNLVQDKFKHSYFVYKITGHDVHPRNDEQLARLLNIETSHLKFKLLAEKNYILHLLRNESFHLLNQLYYKVPLHKNTARTYQLINSYSINETARLLRLREHTIQDHIIEMMIKDYPVEFSRFINADELQTIVNLYSQLTHGKLKSFYEHSEVKDYFKLKIGIAYASLMERNDHVH
ncbi:hypothetical protein ETH99_01825 [Macrococcoides caseolyticum]|nr:hypothetical protein ETH99_01825 [Macrococcus caseolyticus]